MTGKIMMPVSYNSLNLSLIALETMQLLVLILCSDHSIWFVKYVFHDKIWFIKTSARMLKFESQVVKSNPEFFILKNK